MRPSHFRALIVPAAVLSFQAPASAQTSSNYQCKDGAQFAVAFVPGDKSAHLQLEGKTMRLPKRVAATGTRYAGGDITLRIMKNTTTLQRGKRMTECSVR
jgi:membrane-bound inhibitor of C-type lysozyme